MAAVTQGFIWKSVCNSQQGLKQQAQAAAMEGGGDVQQQQRVGEKRGRSDKKSTELEVDKLIPRSHLARIMKKILPPDATISPDALRVTQSCVKTLTACISTEAGLLALMSKRRVVSGEDVSVALENMGFFDSSDLVKAYTEKYRKAKRKTTA